MVTDVYSHYIIYSELVFMCLRNVRFDTACSLMNPDSVYKFVDAGGARSKIFVSLRVRVMF